jgi:glycosyltransferase involved in cell wall biosynthesis
MPEVEVRKINSVMGADEIRAAAERRRARGSTPPSLGVLSRLIPEKGVLELVEELSELGDSWASLDVGGAHEDQRYVQRIEERAGALGISDRVRLLGHVRPEQLLDRVDVLVVPSTGREGQPSVIIEALAQGCPVVVRAPVWSEDFDGLPVGVYEDPPGLARAFAQPVGEPVPVERLIELFGPRQALEGIDSAALASRVARA